MSSGSRETERALLESISSSIFPSMTSFFSKESKTTVSGVPIDDIQFESQHSDSTNPQTIVNELTRPLLTAVSSVMTYPFPSHNESFSKKKVFSSTNSNLYCSDNAMEQSLTSQPIVEQIRDVITSDSSYLEFEEVFPKLPLGLIMSCQKDSKQIIVSGFVNIAASRNGTIIVGDEIISINETNIEGMKSKAFLKVVSSATCPITILFRRSVPPSHSIVNDNVEGNASEYCADSIPMIQEQGRQISLLISDVNKSVAAMIDASDVNTQHISSINYEMIETFEERISQLMAKYSELIKGVPSKINYMNPIIGDQKEEDIEVHVEDSAIREYL